MKGELIDVWPETWKEIWAKLGKHPDHGKEIFSDLYGGFVPEPREPIQPPQPTEFTDEGTLVNQEDILARQEYDQKYEQYLTDKRRYNEILTGSTDTARAFRYFLKKRAIDENAAIKILEAAFSMIESYEDPVFNDFYYNLVDKFLMKYSVRYELSRPLKLYPTLPGIFARMLWTFKEAARQDQELNVLLVDYENSIKDLREDSSSSRIKTCIQKHINLLEAIGQRAPNVSARNNLSRICDELQTWPHYKVRQAVKDLYTFSCDYPGIRHAGTANNALRDIEMRDMISVSIALAGFYPYLTDLINSNDIL